MPAPLMNLLALVFSLVAITSSAIIAMRQSRIMRHANTLDPCRIVQRIRSGEFNSPWATLRVSFGKSILLLTYP
jgi:hypothetical protein